MPTGSAECSREVVDNDEESLDMVDNNKSQNMNHKPVGSNASTLNVNRLFLAANDNSEPLLFSRMTLVMLIWKKSGVLSNLIFTNPSAVAVGRRSTLQQKYI